MDKSNWHEHKAERPKDDDGYFERMSRIIFTAGLNWHTIDKKWPGIQKAFAHFDIDKVAKFQEMEIEELMMNPDVIRNLLKIRAIVSNAKEMQKVHDEFGSFEAYLGSLRKAGGEDELRKGVSKRFAFLGPGSTAIFLFSVGEDLPKAHQEWLAKFGRH